MGIFDNIDYLEFTVNNLPPNKRTDNTIALNDAILQPIQYDSDNYFDTYSNGSTANPWNSAATYSIGNDVIGDDDKVYRSLINSNTNNNPVLTVSTGMWEVISPNWIGTYERIKYNNSIACLNYLLNRYFRSNFVQPPNMNTSDIYITLNPPPKLILGRANQDGLCVRGRGNFNNMLAGRKNSNTIVGIFFDFTINYPSSFALVDTNFVAKLTASAQKYTVAGYSFNTHNY